MEQVYTAGSSTLTTYYFAGGSYEVDTDGTTDKVIKYYSIAGMSIAMDDGSGLQYFLTDQLGSVVATINSAGAPSSLVQQRYYPFGGVHPDVGTITQTDFGYTGQPFDRLRTSVTWMPTELASHWG